VGKASSGIWNQTHHHHHRHQAVVLVAWPIQVGRVPALASAFQARPNLFDRVTRARAALIGADGRAAARGQALTQVLSGGAGVGKSQTAAYFASEAVQAGIDLVVWVDASTPDGLVATYAEAGVRVQAVGAGGIDADSDAKAFLEWAATTTRSWLVVLDDISDAEQLSTWWPTSHTRAGRVLATTRLRTPLLSGGGRQIVDIDVYEPGEASAYLRQRLAEVGREHLLDDRINELTEALGRLPLALSHAAAYMLGQRIGCGAYLDLYAAGVDELDVLMPADPDGHGLDSDGRSRKITVTLLLALCAADASQPVGLARPAMELISVLDPAGHPEAFWTTEAVINYLTAYRTADSSTDHQDAVTSREARAAIHIAGSVRSGHAKRTRGPSRSADSRTDGASSA
jgi:hypothetical protein